MRMRILFQAIAIVIVHPAAAAGQRQGAERWSSSTRSTRAPAMPGETGLVDGSRDRPRTDARAWPRSATSTKPIARSASRCSSPRRDAHRAMLGADPERTVRSWRRSRDAGRGFRAERDGAAHRPGPDRPARARNRRDERGASSRCAASSCPAAAGGAAQLHLARAIVRRAERDAVAAARERDAQSARAGLSQPACPIICSRSPARSMPGRRRRHICGSRARPA